LFLILFPLKNVLKTLSVHPIFDQALSVAKVFVQKLTESPGAVNDRILLVSVDGARFGASRDDSGARVDVLGRRDRWGVFFLAKKQK